MGIFNKRIAEYNEEDRFNDMMGLVKHLPRRDYNRFKEAMDLGYESYQKILNVKTADEREFADIKNIEKELEKESKKEKKGKE